MADELGGGLDGGRIDIKVVADLSEVDERKLQREIDQRTKAVKAKLAAEIEARQVAVQAQAAGRAAEREAEVRFRATVDRSQLRKELDGAARSDVRMRFRAEVDRAQLRADVDQAAREAATDVEVGADTSPARTEGEKFRQETERRPVRIPVQFDQSATRQAGLLVATLGKVAAAGSGLLLAAAGATALASGLGAAAAAGAQAVGVLGVLPGLVTTAAQGLATLLVGFSGVGTALGALSQADKQAAASGAAAAQAREAAAERIKNAERSIRDAAHARMLANERVGDARDATVEAAKAVEQAEARVREAVDRVAAARQRVSDAVAAAADRQEQAARRVEMAERRVAEASRATERATQDLNEARRQAKERLEDLALAAKGGALDEESAQIAIERAKERLEAVMKDPFASDLDKREADLAYRQALQRLAEVKERNGDLSEEKAEADARGVEGSKEVEAAKERLAASIQAEKDAEYELSQARKDAARSAVDSARAIADAQRGVSEAIEGVKEAQDGVKAAQKAQVRAARDLREALWDQMLAVERLKDAESELAKARKAARTAGQTGGGGGVDPAAQALAELSPLMRDLVLFIHRQVRPELKDLKWDVQDALAPPLKEGVKQGMPLLGTIRKGLVATAKEIGRVISDPREGLGALFGSRGFNQDVTAIMASNARATGTFGRAGVKALSGVRNVLVVALPYVERFADLILDGADRFDSWSKRVRDDGSLAAFFEDAWETASKLWRIVKNVGGAIIGLFRPGQEAGGTLLEDLAKSAEEFNKWIDQPETQERLRRFFDQLIPLMREAGGLIKDVAVFLGRITEAVVDDGTLTDFLAFLRGVVQWLTKISDIPFVGDILGWIFVLGVVSVVIGTLLKKLSMLTKGIKLLGKAGKGLGKLTGLSKLLGGGDDDDEDNGGKRGRKGGGPDVDVDLGGGSKGAKDAAKNADQLADSYDRVGRSADQAGKKTRDLGGGIDDAGKKADSGAKKTSILTRALDGLRTSAGKVGAGLGGLAGMLGLDKVGDVGTKLRTALSKVDVAGSLKKVNPASLIAKPSGQINTGSWFSKLNPRGLFGDVGSRKIDPGGGMQKVRPDSVFDTSKKIDASSWFAKLNPAALFDPSGGAGKKTGTPRAPAGTGKAGKAGTGAKVGVGAAGVGLAVAGMFGQDFITEVLAKAEQHLGKTGAGAAKGAIDGGLIGSVVGPIGSLLGAVYGAINGTVKGAGGNTTAAALGSLVSAPMGLAAGLIPSPEEAAKKLAPTIMTVKKNWADMWSSLTGQSNTYSAALNTKIGAFTSGTTAKFVTLKQNAPAAVRDAWAAIQADINAGLPPSQAKIDAFVQAGGARFLDLKKDAPLAVHGMLADIQNHAATSLPITQQKFTSFVQAGNAKFLELKAGAPKALQDAWRSIQADAAAGLPPSKAKIDTFIKDGGLAFLKLKKDAPATAKATWKDVSDSTTSGLKPAETGVSGFLKRVREFFGEAKGRISTAWSGVAEAVRAPIKGVIDSLYNNGIVRLWNSVAGKLKLPTLPTLSFARGGVVPPGGYGVLPGYSPGRDTMLAAVSPGEAWLRPEAARWLGTRWINAINTAARHGRLQRFASGGVVGTSSADLYAASRSALRARQVVQDTAGVGGGSATVNVFPQPGQDEIQIGNQAARRLGALIR
ncbi:hypothetical protein [Nonomuraea candida]|uniref:hypothetical protein n=1 Tax=Nonomuraea candida TaxID=359159 RepID=UPI0005BADF90|nr:hypothetical protein [Nonomuraea candida]